MKSSSKTLESQCLTSTSKCSGQKALIKIIVSLFINANSTFLVSFVRSFNRFFAFRGFLKTNGLFFLFFYCGGTSYSQVETMVINKETFLKPTVSSMGYLMLNVDSAKWQESLLPIGLSPLHDLKKVYLLEFLKNVNGMSQYIALRNAGIDNRFVVLTIIWKDESGKNSIISDLKKALKKNEYNNTGYYKIKYNGMELTIELESDKEKVINEMITVEIETK